MADRERSSTLDTKRISTTINFAEQLARADLPQSDHEQLDALHQTLQTTIQQIEEVGANVLLATARKTSADIQAIECKVDGRRQDYLMALSRMDPADRQRLIDLHGVMSNSNDPTERNRAEKEFNRLRDQLNSKLPPMTHGNSRPFPID